MAADDNGLDLRYSFSSCLSGFVDQAESELFSVLMIFTPEPLCLCAVPTILREMDSMQLPHQPTCAWQPASVVE